MIISTLVLEIPREKRETALATRLQHSLVPACKMRSVCNDIAPRLTTVRMKSGRNLLGTLHSRAIALTPGATFDVKNSI